MPSDTAIVFETLEYRIRTLLSTIDNRTLAKHDSLPTLEAELLKITKSAAFKKSLLSGNRLSWFIVSSLEPAHELAFLSFCGWGMALEKIVALLMSLKPPCAAPASWRRGYIKLFAAIAAYRWKPASLAMAMNKIENKADISAVSLRIVLKHAYRAKNFVDLVMAIRTYIPDLNASLESALGGFLEEVSNQNLDIRNIPRELFAPHQLNAGRNYAPSCSETRRILWDSDLSYESRISIGKSGVEWQECDLARNLGWSVIQDVIDHLAGVYEQVGQGAIYGYLESSRPDLALAKVAFYQSFTALEHLCDQPRDLGMALFQTGFVRASVEASKEGRHPELQHLMLRKTVEPQNHPSSALQ